jgi:hypothetical protein
MNVFAFIVAMVLFVAGMLAFGYSFTFPGYEALVFVAGILLVGAALAIPAHILKRTDR